MNPLPSQMLGESASVEIQARGRSNLTVITGAIARRVIIEGGHATSVEYERHGRKRTIFCAREVIVSASTIGSAKLLLLSGIGPAEELRNVGVKPVIDLPGVGKNLQEHVAPLLVWSVKTPTYNRLRNPLFV